MDVRSLVKLQEGNGETTQQAWSMQYKKKLAEGFGTSKSKRKINQMLSNTINTWLSIYAQYYFAQIYWQLRSWYFLRFLTFLPFHSINSQIFPDRQPPFLPIASFYSHTPKLNSIQFHNINKHSPTFNLNKTSFCTLILLFWISLGY